MGVSSFAEDFAPIVDLCATLESATVSPRLRARLCHVFDRAIGKALCMNWDKMPSEHYVHLTLRRHAERGARDFVP